MSFVENKTMIVTGASRGIGRALGLALAEGGAGLVLNARSPQPLEEAAAQCREAGARVVAIAGDVSNAGVCASMVAEAQMMGEFGGFVHAAGVLKPGPLLHELDEADFDAVFHASVKGAYQLARHAYPVLRQAGGAAVFFGSGAAQITQPGIAAYCAAKAAEEHLARQLADESPNVSVIIYRPGIVETRMQEQARQAEGGAAEQLHAVFRRWKEQGELISPEQSAAALMRLLQDPGEHHGRTVRADDLL
jgi:NAD(P)-dependent dehydrogenase (short-subunit alcohol dehydrogenase family)